MTVPAAIAASVLALVVAALADPPTRHARSESQHASASEPTDAPVRCNRQRAQAFLIRGNYVGSGGSQEDHDRRHAAHLRAIRYRTEHYGYFDGFGEPSWNSHPPRYYAASTTFMGEPVVMNRRVVPALRCVEAEIRHTCSAHPYRARALAGIRFHNTYHTGEITNHVYGIAIDVDPDRNTCCHCVGRWAQAPRCLRHGGSIWDRMEMPECWVDAFERYGFYWLGHDTLQDTMHFEFLGDPDRIVAGGGT